MKIELKPHKRKHFFKFVFNMLNFKLLRNLGYLSFKNWIKIIKNRKSESHSFIILMNKKIVGGTSLVKDIETKNWIIGIFLFKKYQGKGISAKASKLLGQFAKKKKIKKFYAETFVWNKEVIGLLKKLRFKETNRNKKDIFWEKELK